jgi:beta-glucosidase-like glycosyl hydrolase/CubicO group peptidase (beta-lactamase class C family)
MDPPFYNLDASRWADSVLKTLTPDERTAQLFMVAAWSNKDSLHALEIDSLIRNYKIGGLIFFQGGPVRQAVLTNRFQALSKVPMLVGIDGEWGLSMRLDSTLRFPRQMTLSAMKHPSLIYKMGESIARHCNRMGIHMNFSPDADINNNPQNPVIGSRSFSDDKTTVTNNSLVYMRALQDHHILATGKHFPGHGDTDTDSHLALPVIHATRDELDSMELAPFRELIKQGLGGMMVAHLFVPALDSVSNRPTTLSREVTTGLLKEELGFKGLIFTDALNMQAVSAVYPPGVVDKLALLAGNDMLLRAENVPRALEEIRLAIAAGEITQEEIDKRVKKVLMVKHWCGLNRYQPIELDHLAEDLNAPEDLLLQQQLYEESMTLLSNGNLLPLMNLDTLRMASLVIGDRKGNIFQQQLLRYADVDLFSMTKETSADSVRMLFDTLSKYNLVLVGLHNTTMNAQKGYGISDSLQRFMDTLFTRHHCVLADFGNSYTLSRIPAFDKLGAVILTYEDMPVTQSLAAQLIFGGISATGRLPVESNTFFRKNAGVDAAPPFRLKYSLPEDAGLNSRLLSRIDSLAANAIQLGAMPGCQVLVARNQKVVYQKSFGYKTYDSTEAVTNTDLYDIASVTKVAATAQAMMKLAGDEEIDIDKPLSKYVSKLRKTNKKDLTIREIMAHQAGLAAWIPFWKNTMAGPVPDATVYHRVPDKQYSVHVADSLYMKKTYVDSVWKWIYASPLGERGKYVYSDLGPLLLKQLVEKKTDTPFDDYLEKKFYRPLGLHDLLFLPLETMDASRIVPTEDDKVFRDQLLRGFVHDPAAAMLGGVAGNAGLFSDANSLAILLQMVLNNGKYGGRTYLDSATVAQFTSVAYPRSANRRGLMFDKPETDPSKSSPACKSASPKAFGHQGFTGTCVWADPEYNLVYIFLSNRLHPDAANDKLVKLNVRTNIQQVFTMQ